MLLEWLVLQWIIFGVFAASALLYKQYCYHHILGVTFSRVHARHPDVKRAVHSFTLACIGVLMLSIVLGVLTLLPFFKGGVELLMFPYIGLNLFLNSFIVVFYQKKLRRIKEQNKWIYPRSGTENTKPEVSIRQKRNGVSSFFIWLFFGISFVPLILLFLRPDLQVIYPIGIAFIGPVCQLITIFPYYRTWQSYRRPVSANEKVNLWFLQQEDKIQAHSAFGCSLSMLIFWLMFYFVMTQNQIRFFIFIPVFLFTISLLFIGYWQQEKIAKLEDDFYQKVPEEEDKAEEQDSYYVLGFYVNPEDPRFLVPKRSPNMGWTINMGNMAGKLTGAVILIFTLGVIGLCIYSSQKDYNITVQESSLVIDAAMYDMSVSREDIISASIINQLPANRRTNGYGGMKKSFGHFFVEGYGKTMFYVYNDVGEYILIKLKNSNPGYIIMNEKTTEETRALYQNINDWFN